MHNIVVNQLIVVESYLLAEQKIIDNINRNLGKKEEKKKKRNILTIGLCLYSFYKKEQTQGSGTWKKYVKCPEFPDNWELCY